MSNKEIVVVDNYGDDLLRDFVVKKGNGVVRYVLSNKTQGVSAAKNAVFDVAEGENVLIIDSHILIQRGCFDVDIPENTFVQGIAVGNGFDRYSYQWSPRWNAGMWGVFEWKTESEMPKEPVDIWGMGAGFFACKRNEWLGFNEGFRGFGGETGYIQEKYRKAGKRVVCYPNMRWVHFYCNNGRKISPTYNRYDRVRNYMIGFKELGLDLAPIKNEFGNEIFDRILKNGI